jgi:hypothetical protein
MGKVCESEGNPRESEGNTEKPEGNLRESEGNAEEPEGNRSELKREDRTPSPDDPSPGYGQRPLKGLKPDSSGAVPGRGIPVHAQAGRASRGLSKHLLRD